MIYKKYGNTNIDVSAVGFGGMRFDLSKSDKENARLLHYAKDKGINYFDTAPGYCQDHSEDIFGIALKDMAGQRNDIYISTKAMPTEFDTAQKAIAAVEKSLKRLNIETIDFFHVWCIRTIEQYDLTMKPGGLYEGLVRCKQEGKIRNIVVSSHMPGKQITQILSNDEFKGILLGVNIINFLYRWEGIQAAHDMGLGVVAMNPLAGGVIPGHEKQLAFLADVNETPTEAALRFCIRCPQITITLNGFTTTEHIDAACKVANSSKPFTQEDIDRVSKHLSTNFDSLCTGCGYCMNNVCSKNIPIAGYMQYYNEKFLEDKDDKGMAEQLDFHYTWGLLVDHKAEAADCILCRQCEEVCTQHLDIMHRLKQICKWQEKIKT